jgi:hypothetical protein
MFFIFGTSADAQRWKLSNKEIYGGLGTSNYFGDIGGATKSSNFNPADLDIVSTRPSINLGMRYRFAERFAARGNFGFGMLHGSDIGSINEERNFAFKSMLIELSGQVMFSITEEKQVISYSAMNMRQGLRKFNARPHVYAFAGIGGAYFKTQALEALDGSARFDNSSSIALSFPVGLGIRYPFSPRTWVGFELGGRITTSDYLDGFASQYSTSNDVYYFSQFFVSYKLKNRVFKPRRRNIRF